MPIGKNSLKRVTGARAEAPKEEKIAVVEEKAKETKPQAPKAAPKTAPAKKAATPKKPTPVKKVAATEAKKESAKKPSPKKSMETEPTFSPVNTAKKVVAKPTKKVNEPQKDYINIGGELPIHLL